MRACMENCFEGYFEGDFKGNFEGIKRELENYLKEGSKRIQKGGLKWARKELKRTSIHFEE